MIRERNFKIMIFVSVFISIITAVQFIYFIDQFPLTGTYSITMRNIDFLDGSFINNGSYIWMLLLIGFNALTLGLGYFFFKPSNQKLIEVSLYNLLLSILFIVGLYLYVSMFPETVTGAVEHGFLQSSFSEDGSSFKSVNIIFVLTMGYFILNTVFLSLKDEK